MTETELRTCYETVYKMVTRERRMRESVLASSPLLKKKLEECDTALAAVTAMKDELKRHVTGPIQEVLVDVPETKRGGY